MIYLHHSPIGLLNAGLACTTNLHRPKQHHNLENQSTTYLHNCSILPSKRAYIVHCLSRKETPYRQRGYYCRGEVFQISMQLQVSCLMVGPLAVVRGYLVA